jgi:nucleoside-diphosphate-sugar epimerase
MRVFVTGASGWVGRSVVQDLLNHGHQVLGLARTDASAELISKAGAEPHRGGLEDVESLKSGAKAADAVIHLAFIHDFTNMPKSTAADRAAIEAIGEAIEGTQKPFVITSGTLIAQLGRLATEDTDVNRNNPASDRWKSEDLLQSLAKEKQIHGMVVRLPPSVHGAGDKGFISLLINFARRNGAVTYIGDGSARWPTVHRHDAAVLFRLAIEKGTAGAVYHAVAEQGVLMKDIMTVIGNHTQLPVESKPLDEAVKTLGFFAHAISSDNPTSSEKTQAELGWHPEEIALLPDMEAHYFGGVAESK